MQRDADSSGFLRRAELRGALESLGLELGDEELDEIEKVCHTVNVFVFCDAPCCCPSKCAVCSCLLWCTIMQHFGMNDDQKKSVEREREQVSLRFVILFLCF